MAKILLQLFAASTTASSSHNKEESSSSTRGGSSTSTVGGSTSESHSYGESHATGGSQSQSAGKTWASGDVEANTAAKREQYNTDYQQGDNVTATYDRLQATLDKKPAYQSQYENKLNELYDQILNRDKFSYDFNADNMYQLYKDQYTTQGRKAMQDTLGQASALNSGYGSSYAQSAAQQTYQNYLQDLNNMIPTLRNQAYNEYMQEGQDLLNKYNVSSDAYNREYGQYRDSVADWQADRSFNYGMYSDERNFDYNKFNADRNYWNQEYWNERNSAQSNQQAAAENNWNDAYSKQDTYTNTKYWENSNTNYWSDTVGNNESWSNGFSSTDSGNSGAASRAQADFSKIVNDLQNTNRNNLTPYEITNDTRSFLSDYGLGADSVFANMSGSEANRVLSEMAQQANTASSLNEYLQLLDDMQQRFNLSDAEIQAIMKKSNR